MTGISDGPARAPRPTHADVAGVSTAAVSYVLNMPEGRRISPATHEAVVIGVDTHPIGAISSPPLTTVEFDPAAVASAAVTAVLTQLGYPAPAPPQFPDIARLVIRSST